MWIWREIQNGSGHNGQVSNRAATACGGVRYQPIGIGRRGGGGGVIERLYFERVADGVYDVVCNDLVTTAPAGDIVFGSFLGIAYGVESVIEVMTNSHRDECEYPDDMAGVRVGYKPLDLVGVAYGGEVRVVPEFQRERVAQRLMEAVGE